MAISEVISCFHMGSSGGLGDYIRGSIYLYEWCRDRGIRFSCDLSAHKVGRHIYGSRNDKLSDADIINVHSLPVPPSATPIGWGVYKHKLDVVLAAASGVVRICSIWSDNLFGPGEGMRDRLNDRTLDDSTRSFFRRELRFSERVRDAASEVVELAGGGAGYSVCHCRVGDYEIVKNRLQQLPDGEKEGLTKHKNFSSKLPTWSAAIDRIIRSNHFRPTLFCSDSNELKRVVLSRVDSRVNGYDGVAVAHCFSNHCVSKPGALMRTSVDLTVTDLQMFAMAVDAALLTKATFVRSYSGYAWGSGFACWLPKIYGIPVSMAPIQEAV